MQTMLSEIAVTTSFVHHQTYKEIKEDGHPIIIKGVHCAYDARKAEEMGATGVVWSNHAGRQRVS